MIHILHLEYRFSNQKPNPPTPFPTREATVYAQII